jgi:hypothetical protein
MEINRRARPGKGKLAWGLGEGKLAELSALGKNEDVRKHSVATAFFQFTKIYVGHARDLAKSGQKDDARNWHRYFENARVVEMLSTQNAFENSTIEKLKHEIQQLGTECHPLDVADWQTDIEAIRHCLEHIVKNLPRQRAPKKSGVAAGDFSLPFQVSVNWRKSHKRGDK